MRSRRSHRTGQSKNHNCETSNTHGAIPQWRESSRAFDKTVVYKRHSRNHLLDQVESFRVGDRGTDREDDLLDTFCYGIALALGNSEGF
jgi:hypothetical protein